jgi:peptidyl-prolyl cis-trans isomerase A (cyclophilin A)
MNERTKLIVRAAAAVLVATGCESSPTPSPQKQGGTPPTPTTAAVPAPTAAASAPAANPGGPSKAKGPFPESTNPALRDPSKAKDKAPATFKVKFETTQGDFEVDCHRDWAPNGVDRFYNLAKIGFFDDVAFFRVVKTPKPFVVQFGIHGNPDVAKVWQSSNLPPDPVKETNTRGTLTYAMAGSPDTRSSQIFVNLGDNPRLDTMGFAPICKVVGSGMDIVDKLESSYGETPSRDQGQIQSQGNAFLRQKFPLLDYVKTARLSDDKGGAAAKPSK